MGMTGSSDAGIEDFFLLFFPPWHLFVLFYFFNAFVGVFVCFCLFVCWLLFFVT